MKWVWVKFEILKSKSSGSDVLTLVRKDNDKDGVISMEEFKTAISKKVEVLTTEEIHNAFRQYQEIKFCQLLSMSFFYLTTFDNIFDPLYGFLGGYSKHQFDLGTIRFCKLKIGIFCEFFCFRIFDKNGDNYITTAELREVLKDINLGLTDEEIEEMIFAADIDGDNKVFSVNSFVLHRSISKMLIGYYKLLQAIIA